MGKRNLIIFILRVAHLSAVDAYPQCNTTESRGMDNDEWREIQTNMPRSDTSQ